MTRFAEGLPVRSGATNKPVGSFRIVELDALRGLAALQVVLYHFTGAYGHEFGWPGDGPMLVMAAPQIGTAIFFVISGFVISLTLERCTSATDFAVSRFARLFPPFWACCLITTASIVATGFNPFHLTPIGFLATLTMANGTTDLPFIDPSYWTLTRELFFYVLLAAIYFAAGKQHVVACMLAWVVLSALYNVTLADGHYYACSTAASCGAILSNALFAHLFAAGVMLYKLRAGERGPLVYLTLGLAILCSAVAEWPTHHLSLLGPVKTAIYAGLLAVAAFGFLPLLRSRVLVSLGAVSYCLYLLHQVIGVLLIHAMLSAGLGADAAVAAAFTAVLMLAAAVCVTVERPAQRRIRTWYRQRGAAMVLIPPVRDPVELGRTAGHLGRL